MGTSPFFIHQHGLDSNITNLCLEFIAPSTLAEKLYTLTQRMRHKCSGPHPGSSSSFLPGRRDLPPHASTTPSSRPSEATQSVAACIFLLGSQIEM